MNFKTSKGEQKIIELLMKNGFTFKREVSFDGLIGEKGVPLRFDFAAFYKGRFIALLEFDGAAHFKYIQHFHKNPMGFRKAREWDRKKNSYCLRNKIPLIRVPYWDLEKLTIQSLFSEPLYKVRDKYHNDNLINGGVK